MKFFSFKKFIQRTFFCCFHCVCIRRLVKTNCEEEIWMEPNPENHPIFDLEKGEL